MESTGLTFSIAREILLKSIKHVLVVNEEKCRFSWNTLNLKVLAYLTILPIVVIVLYIILINVATSPIMFPSILTALVIICFITIFNLILYILYEESQRLEIFNSIKSVLLEYEEYIRYSNTTDDGINPLTNNEAASTINTKNKFIKSGHSQVSIVHVCRQGLWQRLPVLLLVEGDIIALMGGDVTPGSCYELQQQQTTFTQYMKQQQHVNNVNTNNNNESSIGTWKIGKLFMSGEKVHIRNKVQYEKMKYNKDENGNIATDINYSQGNERHRTLSSESTEILSLSGDIRCFQLAETPIVNYLQHVILKDTVLVHEDSILGTAAAGSCFQTNTSQHCESSDYQPLLSTDSASLNQFSGNGSIEGQPSFIRNLFIRIATREAFLVQLIVIVILIACVLIRFILITVLSNQEDNSNFTIANWLLAVYLPISITIQCFLPISFPILLIICEALVTADFLTTTEVTLNPNANHSHPSKEAIHRPNESTLTCTTKQNSSAGTTMVYSDSKDINGSTTFISKGRGGVNTATNNNVDDTFPLNIDIDIEEGPASHSDDEFLDEDIDERADEIAEEVSTQFNWSRYMHYVQNIIYQRILSNKVCDYWIIFTETSVVNNNCSYLLPIPLARSHLLEVIGAITMVCFIDDDVICEDYSVTEEIFLLMDNQGSQSTSRPSRDDHYTTITTNSNNHHVQQSAPGEINNLNKPAVSATSATVASAKGMVLDLHANPEATGSRFENPQWWRYLPSLKPLGLDAMLSYNSSSNANILNSSYNNSSNTYNVNNSITRSKSVDMRSLELGLVRQIRYILPLEALRELSEEIGFVAEDLTTFNKILEVNVLAPGLENSHLLEDTHQWGQEESRRRGSLLPQLRSGVYEDIRDGSLQMMSLGDPNLVLNYCREYWDGSTRSITPLSRADRAEVLSVFERWRLEDFEVVAFCYSPLPTIAIQPLLLKGDDQQQQQASLFFVDPMKLAPSSTGDKLTTTCIPQDSLTIQHSHTAKEVVSYKENLLLLTNNENNIKSEIVNDLHLNKLLAIDIDNINERELKKPYLQLSNNNINRNHSKCDSQLNMKSIDNISGSSVTLISKNIVTEEITSSTGTRHLGKSKDDSFINLKLIHSPGLISYDSDGLGLQQYASVDNLFLNNNKFEANLKTFSMEVVDKGYRRRNSESHSDNNNVLADTVAVHPEKRRLSSKDQNLASKYEEQTDGYSTIQYDNNSNNLHTLSVANRYDAQVPLSKKNFRKGRPNTGYLATAAAGLNAVPPTTNQQTRQLRRASTRQLWSLIRQQVFLGMAASSVPVRKEVPNTKEDLNTAGVRFVYFSAQNMKRSKPVAEKIGIPFDWNCAISLRELDANDVHDPHRHISKYADWDVLARMPHGVASIKSHLKTVDNVPLLVSLFTDATPHCTRQMIQVFREYGEVVLSIGGGYRSHNHAIYDVSDCATSVSVLPGFGYLPAFEKDLIELFPLSSQISLNRADILLSFRFIGLATVNILQAPFHQYLTTSATSATKEKTSLIPPQHIRLPVLIEAIHKGRIILRNLLQSLAFLCVSTLSLGLWPLLSIAVPLSIPPVPSPSIILLFSMLYLPTLCLALVQCGEPESVMKNTPRKNVFSPRPSDISRFYWYLVTRSLFVVLSIAFVGWLCAASTYGNQNAAATFITSQSMQRFYYLDLNNPNNKYNINKSTSDTKGYWLVQDVMTSQALLSIIAQSLTMLVRGQTEYFPSPSKFPDIWYYIVIFILCGIQAVVMMIRALMRYDCDPHHHNYANLHWIVWLAMFTLPLLGIVLGLIINRHDNHSYRRYLQFLRLEFDTRLGMHSPR